MGSRDEGNGAPRWNDRHVRAGLLLMVLLLVFTLAAPGAAAFSLPGRRAVSPEQPALATGRSRLQEVAPPLAVQQLQEALDGRRPLLEILSPADGALLPEGPWTLRLQVEDWPLVDAGPLGLGPHVVVQLDGDPPLPLTSTSATMRPLEPGSHRLTVYAVRPWGEAVKSPGAQRQIRLHRAVANPLSQPAQGTPQLIAVSPRGRQAGPPLLLDWLLLDAPLQNLRPGDASWRLRVSVDGDSFLLDQQTPLWLEGWSPGSNAILLELLDGLGEPLNPPFNSLAGEVILEADGPAPRWRGGRLEPSELASLLGEAPPPTIEPVPDPDVAAAPEPAHEANLPSGRERAPDLDPAAELVPEPAPDPASKPAQEANLEPAPEAEAGTTAEASPEEQADLPPPEAPGPPDRASPAGPQASTEESGREAPAPEASVSPPATLGRGLAS